MSYSETRPWGWFETVLTGPQYQVKQLVVNANQRLSLQKHAHREEHWVVVSGFGTITVGDKSFPASPGTTAYIPKGEWHRLEAGDGELKLIEVQRGSFLYEEDITRKSDDYGRK